MDWEDLTSLSGLAAEIARSGLAFALLRFEEAVGGSLAWESAVAGSWWCNGCNGESLGNLYSVFDIGPGGAMVLSGVSSQSMMKARDGASVGAGLEAISGARDVERGTGA